MGNSTEQTTWFLKHTAKGWGLGEEKPRREGIYRLRERWETSSECDTSTKGTACPCLESWAQRNKNLWAGNLNAEYLILRNYCWFFFFFVAVILQFSLKMAAYLFENAYIGRRMAVMICWSWFASKLSKGRGRERMLIKQDWPHTDCWHFVKARWEFVILLSLLLYMLEIFL